MANRIFARTASMLGGQNLPVLTSSRPELSQVLAVLANHPSFLAAWKPEPILITGEPNWNLVSVQVHGIHVGGDTWHDYVAKAERQNRLQSPRLVKHRHDRDDAKRLSGQAGDHTVKFAVLVL